MNAIEIGDWYEFQVLQRSPGVGREMNVRRSGYRRGGQAASTESRRRPGDEPSTVSLLTSMKMLQRSPGVGREMNLYRFSVRQPNSPLQRSPGVGREMNCIITTY